MIGLALVAAAVAPTPEQVDVHNLSLPEAVFACDTPNHQVDFLLLGHGGAGGTYLSFENNAKGSLFRAPVTSASGVRGVSLRLKAEGKKKGEQASVMLGSGQTPTTFVLTTDQQISGTCRFVPMPFPKLERGQ
jgi:hypothetical protein